MPPLLTSRGGSGLAGDLYARRSGVSQLCGFLLWCNEAGKSSYVYDEVRGCFVIFQYFALDVPCYDLCLYCRALLVIATKARSQRDCASVP